MSSWFSVDSLIELMLGISLSAACGFRVFVPLLVMSAAAVLGQVDLPSNLDWVESQQALVLFAIASVIEIVGYYIPWFDSILEVVALPAAVIAGTIVTASTAPEQMNPLVQWTLAFFAGGGIAGVTRGMNWFLRIISTAVSAGLTNPVLATLELAIALLLTGLALTMPLLGGVVIGSIWIAAIRKIRQFRAGRKPDPHQPDAVA
ncbi:MAG: DUF4126 domain-containing protein [Kaiparowitsia implicata GSE-PSE-MK54-09C]|jgi:hypothetical protein|nr:DUF4126 domain-containing protein [Kaiparowitsia implicata GSE-PSE-MK54-09C]